VAKAFKATNKVLGKYLDTNKKSGRLLPHLEKWALLRPDEERDLTYLHPSSMAKSNWCFRASYYQLNGMVIPKDPIPFSRMNMFEEGHLIHSKWQRYLRDMGVLWGEWENGKYKEVPLVHPTLPVRGMADGLVVGLGDDFIIEIKSMGAGTFRVEDYGSLVESGGDLELAWKELRSPFMAHRKQAMIYMGIAHDMGDDWYRESPPEEAVLLYENKANQEVKEFVVPYSSIAWSRVKDDVRLILSYIKDEVVPPCNVKEGGCGSCKPYDSFLASS